jgi:hypothetical protein
LPQSLQCKSSILGFFGKHRHLFLGSLTPSLVPLHPMETSDPPDSNCVRSA